MAEKPESNSTDEIEITAEMIEAAAEVLWAEPALERDMTRGWAADIATRMLRRALIEHRVQKCESGPTEG